MSEFESNDESTNCVLSSIKIQMLIKTFVLELATNASIDNRNYSMTSKSENLPLSPLAESIAANGNSFDLGIAQLAKSIESDDEMIQALKDWTELHADEKSDNFDEIYETETVIFYRFIELSGLTKILSSHWDVVDHFWDKFFELLYSF